MKWKGTTKKVMWKIIESKLTRDAVPVSCTVDIALAAYIFSHCIDVALGTQTTKVIDVVDGNSIHISRNATHLFQASAKPCKCDNLIIIYLCPLCAHRPGAKSPLTHTYTAIRKNPNNKANLRVRSSRRKKKRRKIHVKWVSAPPKSISSHSPTKNCARFFRGYNIWFRFDAIFNSFFFEDFCDYDDDSSSSWNRISLIKYT